MLLSLPERCVCRRLPEIARAKTSRTTPSHFLAPRLATIHDSPHRHNCCESFKMNTTIFQAPWTSSKANFALPSIEALPTWALVVSGIVGVQVLAVVLNLLVQLVSINCFLLAETLPDVE